MTKWIRVLVVTSLIALSGCLPILRSEDQRDYGPPREHGHEHDRGDHGDRGHHYGHGDHDDDRDGDER